MNRSRSIEFKKKIINKTNCKSKKEKKKRTVRDVDHVEITIHTNNSAPHYDNFTNTTRAARNTGSQMITFCLTIGMPSCRFKVYISKNTYINVDKEK